MIEIKFKKLQEDAVIPFQATEGSANFDFTCVRIEQRSPNKYTLFFGLAVEFPHKYKMVIVPRSSITGTDAIQQNSPGQVDSDYRGELQLRITMLPVGISMGIFPVLVYPECPFKVGDRVAQGYLERVVPVQFTQVKNLTDTVRGTGGFGSTGTSIVNQEKEGKIVINNSDGETIEI